MLPVTDESDHRAVGRQRELHLFEPESHLTLLLPERDAALGHRTLGVVPLLAGACQVRSGPARWILSGPRTVSLGQVRAFPGQRLDRRRELGRGVRMERPVTRRHLVEHDRPRSHDRIPHRSG